MTLFSTLKHDVVQETLTSPGHEGLNLSFSTFAGYSPVLDGAVHVRRLEQPNSAKSGSIAVAINVKAGSPLYKDNIRVSQQGNSINISTGGLSLLNYTTASRLLIDIAISLPQSIGDLNIKTISLPISVQKVEKANDVVLHTESSSITVEHIDARSLTVSTQSGSIAFKDQSEQKCEKFITVSNLSGSTSMRSSLSSPSLQIQSTSGSISLAAKSTATDLKIENLSGSIGGELGYSNASSSKFENISGSTSVKLAGWSGFVTAESRSGRRNVFGSGVERWNNGWKKGDGSSKAAFSSISGSISVELL